MKFPIVFAAVLAVSSAQFPGFGQQQLSRYTPRPPLPPPRPSGAPIVNVNRVASSDQAANIVRYENNIYPDGTFDYGYETDNGIAAQVQGTVRDLGGNPPEVAVAHVGSFSWIAPDGQKVSIAFNADEGGYQPQGDAIPTPHPIPEAILRALDFIAKNPPAPQKK